MVSTLTVKLISIVVVVVSALFGGLLPMKWKKFRDSARTISFTNSFAAGLFLGVGIFHLLPEAEEDYTSSKGIDITDTGTSFPIIFFIMCCSYTFILFLDRVLLYEDHDAFHDEHSDHVHTPREHIESTFRQHIEQHEENALLLEKAKSHNPETQKDGDFSYSLNRAGSMDAIGTKKDEPRSKVLVSRQLSIKQANFSPTVIFVALTLHAIFEGIAIGLETTLNATINLCVAILIHKWAEALALGARVVKARTEPWVVYTLIGGFAIATPIGICIGLSILNAPLIWSAVFKAISAGTFLYLSATEIAVEEFGGRKDRYWKFLFYLLGLVLITFATMLE